jgi:hypothetical protein
VKVVISILIALGLFYAAKNLMGKYDEITKKGRGEITAAAVAPVQLTGLPERLEPLLADAQRSGHQAFKAFLDRYRTAIQDPRLGDLQLDYVLAVSRSNLSEARQVFAEVQARTPLSSPLYPRVKRLANSYQ